MLFNEDGILAFRKNEQQSNHGQVIHRHIEELLEEAGIDIKNLTAICVLNGPGSYTGLRISLSAAKGFCYAYDIPLILINKLELIYSCACKDQKHVNACVIMKARDDEYFTASYEPDQENNCSLNLKNRQEVIDQIKDKKGILIAEDPILKTDFADLVLISPQMEEISGLCLKYFFAAKHADLFSSEPFYLKNVFINKTNKL